MPMARSKIRWGARCYCRPRALVSCCYTTVTPTSLWMAMTRLAPATLPHSRLFCFRFGLQESQKLKQNRTRAPDKWNYHRLSRGL